MGREIVFYPIPGFLATIIFSPSNHLPSPPAPHHHLLEVGGLASVQEVTTVILQVLCHSVMILSSPLPLTVFLCPYPTSLLFPLTHHCLLEVGGHACSRTVGT